MDTLNAIMLGIGWFVSAIVLISGLSMFAAWAIPFSLGKINHVRNVTDLFDKLRRQELMIRSLQEGAE